MVEELTGPAFNEQSSSIKPCFKEFAKIPRLNREVVVSEKIDGTNACVVVEEAESFADRRVYAQSRSRIITPDSDNYGFAKWVEANADNLRQLGPGYHYGEWWGKGIQRGYGLEEKRFSLFNTWRWKDNRPSCCHVVPVIATLDGFNGLREVVQTLVSNGSIAAPGFMGPEGVICFHVASNQYFKVTCKNDEKPKGSKE